MHVAYVINQYPTVSHSFIRREILSLEQQGVQVHRFALRGWDADVVDPSDAAEKPKTEYTLKGGLMRLGLAALGYAVTHPKAFLRGLKRAWGLSKGAVRPFPVHLVYLAHACRIRQRLQGTEVTHIHAHFGTNSTEVAALVTALGGPGYSFTVHGSEVHINAEANRLDAKVAGAQFVAAVCQYIGSQIMLRSDPAHWDKITTVHCGLPQTAYAAADTAYPADPVFLCVGRLSAEKGHLVLLEAFAKLYAQRPDARLVFGGDGPLRAELEAQITALGVQKAVTFLGWITSDQVKAALAECQIFVQPSFIEGLPVSIMEAMAARRPVIASGVAGIPELVRPGQTGWLVPPGDPDALAEAMLSALDMPQETLLAYGAAGQDWVRARHAIETEAAKLKRLFEKADPTRAA